MKFLFINFLLDFSISGIDRTNVATCDKPLYVPECVVTWPQRPWSAVFGPLQESWTIQFSARHDVYKSVHVSNHDRVLNKIVLLTISRKPSPSTSASRLHGSQGPARQNRRVIKRTRIKLVTSAPSHGSPLINSNRAHARYRLMFEVSFDVYSAWFLRREDSAKCLISE